MRLSPGISTPSSRGIFLLVGLALPLLVARIFADDANDIFALYDAAAFAKAFDGCSYFHDWSVILKNSLFERTKNRAGKGSPQCDFIDWPTSAGRRFALLSARRDRFLAELCRLAISD